MPSGTGSRAIADLAVRRQRVLARVRTHVALLGHARTALLCARTGQVQGRAPSLQLLAERLRRESDEACAHASALEALAHQA